MPTFRSLTANVSVERGPPIDSLMRSAVGNFGNNGPL